MGIDTLALASFLFTKYIRHDTHASPLFAWPICSWRSDGLSKERACPMTLSDENIKKFQEIYKGRFGKDISKEDARKQGVKLLKLVSIIYGPKIKK